MVVYVFPLRYLHYHRFFGSSLPLIFVELNVMGFSLRTEYFTRQRVRHQEYSIILSAFGFISA